MTCDKCGHVFEIGDYPYCTPTSGHSKGFMRVNGDETDYVDHNLGPEPIRITSWSERRRIMDERGLVDTGRYVKPPEGSTPNPQGPIDWNGYRDLRPETLEWVARMLATGKGTKEPEEAPLKVSTYISETTAADLESFR